MQKRMPGQMVREKIRSLTCSPSPMGLCLYRMKTLLLHFIYWLSGIFLGFHQAGVLVLRFCSAKRTSYKRGACHFSCDMSLFPVLHGNACKLSFLFREKPCFLCFYVASRKWKSLYIIRIAISIYFHKNEGRPEQKVTIPT